MHFIGSIIEKLQRHPKRIVFPEGAEPRVLQAARQFASLRLGVPILLGDRTTIKGVASSLNVPLDGIRIINPTDSEDYESFAKHYLKIRESKGMRQSDAKAAMSDPDFYGAMMVSMRRADGFVSGASEYAESALRPLFQIVKVAPQQTSASSCLVMEVADSKFGENGVIFMADCGVIPEPTVEQLAEIAILTAKFARQMSGTPPRVALLSYSTLGSASNPKIGKVQAATQLARDIARREMMDAEFDGEFQVDTAIVPEIAQRKAPDSPVAGRANVLVFPDLNSGNIASKLIQHIARANSYGQILLGLDRPAADVSRGSNSHDILGVAAIVGLQTIDFDELYPKAAKKS